MRFLMLLFVLVLSGVVYTDAHRISALEASLTSLRDELGLYSETTSTLSGKLSTVASIASSTAADAAELARKQAIPVKSQDEIVRANVAAVSPAVVSVIQTLATDEVRIASATGFLVRSNGYIITNRHVVSDTGDSYVYRVYLADGRSAIASIVWRDDVDDLAVLKIAGSGYPTVPLGDSGALEVGQAVFAIGNALGKYENSVSTGVVSGLNRNLVAKDKDGKDVTLANVIQTDAAINKGNSGGPLVNLSGKAVGVNVASITTVENISFSIPINDVKAILTSLHI